MFWNKISKFKYLCEYSGYSFPIYFWYVKVKNVTFDIACVLRAYFNNSVHDNETINGWIVWSTSPLVLLTKFGKYLKG